MSGGFSVDLDELAAHAAYVDDVAARTGGVSGVAQPLGRGAYGVVGQPFAIAAGHTAEVCSAGVASLVVLVRDFGDRLRSSADAYRAADEAIAETITGIAS
jgi:hypothetical protein